jgi:hypothetical protein
MRRALCVEAAVQGLQELTMAARTAIFVSKRLQRPAAALLCLMTAQLLFTLASCEPEPSAMAARVAISPR